MGYLAKEGLSHFWKKVKGYMGDNQNVYSTEETRIGTWIDGKPLYQRVFQGYSPNEKGKTVSIGHLGEGCESVMVSAVSIDKSGSLSPFSYQSLLSVYVSISGYVSVENVAGASWLSGVPVTVIVKYIKTTD